MAKWKMAQWKKDPDRNCWALDYGRDGLGPIRLHRTTSPHGVVWYVSGQPWSSMFSRTRVPDLDIDAGLEAAKLAAEDMLMTEAKDEIDKAKAVLDAMGQR